MSDIYDEHESAVKLIVKEYRNLQKLNSKHRLLSLIKDVNEEGFETTEEFSKKYNVEDGEKGISRQVNVFARYYNSLEIAVTEELNKILGEEKKKYEKDLWRKMEERGLVGAVRTHITHNEVPLIN